MVAGRQALRRSGAYRPEKPKLEVRGDDDDSDEAMLQTEQELTTDTCKCSFGLNLMLTRFDRSDRHVVHKPGGNFGELKNVFVDSVDFAVEILHF